MPKLRGSAIGWQSTRRALSRQHGEFSATGCQRRELAVTAAINTIEVDNLSFVVRAQKFRVAASIMKRTTVPLATEYATRLVHLVRGITPEELAAFFDFEASETRVLLEDVLSSGLV